MKKVSALLLAVALSVSLFACSGDTTNVSSQSSITSTSQSEAPSPVSREEGSAEEPLVSEQPTKEELESEASLLSEAVTNTNSADTGDNSDKKILIAYFTWADNTVVVDPSSVDVDATTSASVLVPGNATRLAQWIQQEAGGDLFSIAVTEPYSSDYDQCLDRAADEKAINARPALTGRVENLDDYDVVFLGYPNWWYTAPMALFTFLDENDLSGKTVIPFCTHGTGGLASSVRDITAYLPNSTVLEPIGVYRDNILSAQDDIQTWIKTLDY